MPARNEHLVVIMAEATRVGREFVEWPLHITIVPWFPTADEAKLDAVMEILAARHQAFEVKVGKIDYFGKKDKLAVNHIEDNNRLRDLHWEVFHSLEKNGFLIHQKDHLGEKYKPHITHQAGRYKWPGEVVNISALSLVKQIRQKKTGVMIKAVVKEYPLATRGV